MTIHIPIVVYYAIHKLFTFLEDRLPLSFYTKSDNVFLALDLQVATLYCIGMDIVFENTYSRRPSSLGDTFNQTYQIPVGRIVHVTGETVAVVVERAVQVSVGGQNARLYDVTQGIDVQRLRGSVRLETKELLGYM